jgi:hypothetical protein
MVQTEVADENETVILYEVHTFHMSYVSSKLNKRSALPIFFNL